MTFGLFQNKSRFKERKISFMKKTTTWHSTNQFLINANFLMKFPLETDLTGVTPVEESWYFSEVAAIVKLTPTIPHSRHLDDDDEAFYQATWLGWSQVMFLTRNVSFITTWQVRVTSTAPSPRRLTMSTLKVSGEYLSGGGWYGTSSSRSLSHRTHCGEWLWSVRLQFHIIIYIVLGFT